MQGLTAASSVSVSYGDPDALLVLAAQREPAEFAALYRRHLLSIYRYLLSRIGNVGDAEDLTAEVFTEALRYLPRYREDGHFTAWLFRIARNKVVDFLRRSKTQLSLDAANDWIGTAEDPQRRVELVETREKLDHLLGQLKEDQRELLRLRFAGGLSYGEIGRITGRSEAATKMAIRRLVRRLADGWEERA